MKLAGTHNYHIFWTEKCPENGHFLQKSSTSVPPLYKVHLFLYSHYEITEDPSVHKRNENVDLRQLLALESLQNVLLVPDCSSTVHVHRYQWITMFHRFSITT